MQIDFELEEFTKRSQKKYTQKENMHEYQTTAISLFRHNNNNSNVLI